MKRLFIVLVCVAIFAGSTTANINVDPVKRKEVKIEIK